MEEIEKLGQDFGLRIKEFIESKNLSVNEFGNLLGQRRSEVLYNVIKGRSIPNMTLVFAIYRAFPSINMDYLITGRGDLTLFDGVNSNIPIQNGFEFKALYQESQKVIEEQQKMIQKLNALI
tara:strand:- start:2087 stop:2452 length:366 start_codon:yes stop_codon:yes gene_type:complete